MTKSTPPSDEDKVRIGQYTVLKELKKGTVADFFLVQKRKETFVLAKLHETYAKKTPNQYNVKLQHEDPACLQVLG